jgi:hypothetical protein
VVIDEAAIVPDLERAWQAPIRPTLTDYKGGAWFLFTPQGIGNYFHTLWRQGQGARSEWASFQAPSRDNSRLDPQEIEKARAEIPERDFRQEYLAEFVTWEGAVFSRLREAVTDAPQGPAAVIGVDWAGASAEAITRPAWSSPPRATCWRPPAGAASPSPRSEPA